MLKRLLRIISKSVLALVMLAWGSQVQAQERPGSVLSAPYVESFYYESFSNMSSMAMGGNEVVAQNGSFGLSENPSLLSANKAIAVDHSFFVRPNYRLSKFAGASIALDDQWTLGVAARRQSASLQYLDFSPDRRETATLRTVALAWKTTSNISVGLNVEYLTRHWQDNMSFRPGGGAMQSRTESDGMVGFGAGVSYMTTKQLDPYIDYDLTVGAGMQNLVKGSMRVRGRDANIPSIFRIGIKHTLRYRGEASPENREDFEVTLHTSYMNPTTTDRNTNITTGIEVGFMDILYYRTGLNFEKELNVGYGSNEKTRYLSQWSHGAGVSLPMQRIAGWEHNVTFSVDFYRQNESSGFLSDRETHVPFGFNVSLTYQP